MVKIPSRPEIDAAAARIAPHVRRTPVIDLPPGTFDLPGRLTLKLEQLQVTGTFKPRGAFNLLLSREVPRAGVVAASGGNFGLATRFCYRLHEVEQIVGGLLALPATAADRDPPLAAMSSACSGRSSVRYLVKISFAASMTSSHRGRASSSRECSM